MTPGTLPRDCPTDAERRTRNSAHNLRRLRLATAMVMLCYVLGHFINHGLGNVSLAAMDAWLEGMVGLWRNPLGGLLLYGSILTHAGLGLWALYARRHLRMAPWEAVQLVSGLLIPPLLLGHAIATRLAFEMYGLDAAYPKVLNVLWVAQPEIGIRQLVLMSIVWLHACIGIHYWLRIRAWYPALQPWLLGIGLLVPVLALLGYIEAGREIGTLARVEGWTESLIGRYGRANPEQQASLALAGQIGYWIMGGLLGGTLVARFSRHWWSRRRGLVKVTYPAGRSVSIIRGTSVLEASRAGGIPHASVCGGRGRCSTCRVRVGRGAESLADADENEARVLGQIQAAPNVRLACQLRPTGDIEVSPLLPADRSARDSNLAPAYVQGVEREVSILFVDLRDSTGLIEQNLPYDVVFILNRFFAAITAGMESAGGHFAQFSGDGMLGLFGIKADADASAGARDAIAAIYFMHEQLDRLNADLAGELKQPLKMGTGLHAGLAIVGAMGNPRSPIVTAVGDAVNVAARLEGLCKQFECEAVISEHAITLAGLDASQFALEEVQLRGRNEALRVRVVDDAQKLRPAPRVTVRAPVAWSVG